MALRILLDLKNFLCSMQATISVSAGVVKLVDTPDLGSGAARLKSSSLFVRTIYVLIL